MEKFKEIDKIALDETQTSEIVEFILFEVQRAEIVEFLIDVRQNGLQVRPWVSALKFVFNMGTRKLMQHTLHHGELV